MISYRIGRLGILLFWVLSTCLFPRPSAAGDPAVVSVKDAFQDSDRDGVPDQIGKTVTLEGVLTSDPYRIRRTGDSVAYLQDDSGGIRLVDRGAALVTLELIRGDVVQVSGTIGRSDRSGHLEVEQIRWMGRGELPLPKSVQAVDLLAGQYPGQLVRLSGRLIVPEGSEQDANGFRLVGRSGEVRVIVWSHFFRDPEFAKRLQRGGKVELIGIADRIPNASSEEVGYVLIPRGISDFHFRSRFPYRGIFIGFAVTVLLLVFVHLIMLRSRARKLAALSESLKRSEEALRDSNQRLEALVQSSPLAIIALDRERNVQTWNPAAERMYGWGATEVLGRPLPNIPEPEWEQHQQYVERSFQGEVLTGKEAQRQRKDGSIFSASLSLSPLHDVSGQINGCIAILMDITPQKQAEEALRASEERYHQLFENAGDFIYTRDFERKFTSLNKAGERMLGYTREELLGRKVGELVAPEYRSLVSQAIADADEGKARSTYEVELIAKDGSRVALEISSQLVYENGKPVGVQGIGRDITERKQLQAQLIQAQKMEAVGRLAGGVAHDFNNLMNVIGGYSELLLEHFPENDKPRHFVEAIQKATDRAASLTRQLLAFSRKQVLQPKVLNLNDVVSDVGKMLQRLIGEDIRVTTVLDPELGRTKVDPGQMEQVILNLAVNARDAMPQGGTLTIQTANAELDENYTRRHPGSKPGPYVVTTVSDNGVGMDAETRKHIFDPFFTTKPVGQGTGLGLSTVYGIVKQSGGCIWVYSEPGRGTTFKIYLPRFEAPLEAAETEKCTECGSQGSETVLVVEDELAMRELAQEFLESCGYHVLDASRGIQALEIVRQYNGPIDLVLTDVIMPGMNGRELADRIAQLRPGTKILYMSGYTDDEVLRRGIVDQGAPFLQKPFTRTALTEKVRELLDTQKGLSASA